MNKLEKQAAFAITSIFTLRMLGLFMLVPVLPVLATALADGKALWVGVSVGVYGCTQALLQMPLGWLSDRLGRKPIILAGLTVFALGSIIAANAESIFTVILGRALQGAGAIAGALLALLSDFTREQQRTKVMALVGVSIGLSFSAAMLLGPWLGSWLGLQGLFWISCGCACLAAVLLLTILPTAPLNTTPSLVFGHALTQVVTNQQLQRLDLSTLLLHMLMTAAFILIPWILVNDMNIALTEHSLFYLPLVLLSFIMMIPFLIWSERKRKANSLLLGAIIAMASSLLLMSFSSKQQTTLALAFIIFFTAFNLMEASLPALVSKTVPIQLRGTAMGVFASSQFLGAFLGGSSAGLLLNIFSAQHVLWFYISITLFWLWYMKHTQPQQNSMGTKK